MLAISAPDLGRPPLVDEQLLDAAPNLVRHLLDDAGHQPARVAISWWANAHIMHITHRGYVLAGG